MIKAIFFDIDGTLISSSRPYMSEAVISGLNELKNKGVKLFIASGRHSLELEELKLNEQFEFDGYLLLNGGYCTVGDKVIYENKINQDDICLMYEKIKEKSYPILFIEKDKMYINRVDQRVRDAQASISTMIPPISQEVNVNQIYQVDPFVNQQELQDIISGTKHIKVTKWHDYAYDIVPIDGGKGAAIEAIMRYYGFKKEELMAFGDGHNDIEMMEKVGYPIVMENGDETLKQLATYICKDSDHDGIIDGLRHFDLISK